MKYSILSMLSVAFLLSACTESEEELLPINPLPSASEGQVIDDQASPAQATEINQALLSGLWEVVLLVDDDEDETAELANYAFAFGGDGTLTATQTDNPDFLEIGTYTLFIDDNRIELAIEFNANEALQNLTDDWYYISSTEESIVFEDDQSELLNALTLQKQ